MTFLFLGNQTQTKATKIEQIKAQHLKTPEARHFDCETLYADKLDKDDLKKALVSLPAVSAKRLVIVHLIERLKSDHQRIIEEFLGQKPGATVLVLDGERTDLKNEFYARLRSHAKVMICDDADKKSAFDMTKQIERRQSSDALKTLYQLVTEGEPPVKILGALVWFWSRMRQKVSRQHFQQGLQCLQEADVNIKRSRLDPVYALEKCVVSLADLLALRQAQR
jgi:DNA polymerase III delta subunit